MRYKYLLLFALASSILGCKNKVASPTAMAEDDTKNDSCALAKPFENITLAQNKVQPGYTGELNNYFGEDKSKIDFKHVFQDGKIVKSYFYFENQQVQEEYNYLCGALHGAQKFYDDKGVCRKIVHYRFGYLNGPGEIFDSTGRLVQSVFFVNDSMVGQPIINPAPDSVIRKPE